MIESFSCKHTELLFRSGVCHKNWRSFDRAARRKLVMLDAAVKLSDLKTPPNNRLEALQRDRAGQHAIRISDQYRVCFRWNASGAHDVEIVDYH